MDIRRDLVFLFEVGSFRNIRRMWCQYLGQEVQTNAEHTFRTALIAIILAQHEGIRDTGRIAKMALVHDLSEIRAGNIAWLHKAYISQDEDRALHDTLVGTSVELELVALFREYEACETIEAQIVKDADMLEADLEVAELAAHGNTHAERIADMKRTKMPKKLHTESGRRMYAELSSTHPSDWLFMQDLLWNSRFSDGEHPEK